MPDILAIDGFEGQYSISRDGRVFSHITNKWLKPQEQVDDIRARLLSGERCGSIASSLRKDADD